MAKKKYEPAELRCPRCRTSDRSNLRRGHLRNNSAFIPAKKRGKKKLQRITLFCLHCGYLWRSIMDLAPELTEISNDEAVSFFDGTLDNGHAALRPSPAPAVPEHHHGDYRGT